MNGLNLHRSPRAGIVPRAVDNGWFWLGFVVGCRVFALLRRLLRGVLPTNGAFVVSDGSLGEGVNLKVNDCLSAASCYERLKFTPESKSWHRAMGFGERWLWLDAVVGCRAYASFGHTYRLKWWFWG
jgi:hypothetical protein